MDETQLAEQEALRKQLQSEQDMLQKFQEAQEEKLISQHDREKAALDEKVDTSKRELEKNVSVCLRVEDKCCVEESKDVLHLFLISHYSELRTSCIYSRSLI